MKKLVQLPCLLAALCFAGTAHASAPEGATRYHLDIGLLSFASISASVNGNDAGGSTQISLGLAPMELGLGFGFVASDVILVGTTVVLNHQITSIDDSDADSPTLTTIGLRPYLEFLLGSGGSTVPFLGLLAGVAHVAVDTGAGSDSATAITFGGMGGAHLMVSSGGSIDLSGQMTYTTTSEGNVDLSVVALALVLSVSAWGL